MDTPSPMSGTELADEIERLIGAYYEADAADYPDIAKNAAYELAKKVYEHEAVILAALRPLPPSPNSAQSVPRSRVMQAAAKAAEKVASWSPAKQSFARRISGSEPSGEAQGRGDTGNCWACMAPINYALARKIRLAKPDTMYPDGPGAAVCSRPECRSYADTCDKNSGPPTPPIPPSEAAGEGRELLERFRDFVLDNATQWRMETRDGQPTNHHNPIWQEIAEALSPPAAGEEAIRALFQKFARQFADCATCGAESETTGQFVRELRKVLP
jgi:hypothetical protein